MIIKHIKEEKVVTLEVFAWQDEEETLQLLAAAFEKEYFDIEIHTNFVSVSEYLQQMMKLKNGKERADLEKYDEV